MTKYIFIFSILFLIGGCAIKEPKFIASPPVSTSKIEENIGNIANSNEKIGVYVDRSLSYADQIESLLKQYQKEKK